MGRVTRINPRSPSDMSEGIQTEKSGCSAPSGRLHPIVVPWVGKLRHDREKFADWGWIRDETGELIVKVPIPLCLSEEDLQKYRREKIDPTQARVDALLNALNGHNDLAHGTAGGEQQPKTH